MEAFYYEGEMLLGALSSLLSGIPSMLLGIASYVMTALALYTIAKRRCLNKPWLAWIPVVRCWILGSLSDQYRYVVKDENKSKRKVLLTLSIINSVLCMVTVLGVLAMVVRVVSGTIYGASQTEMIAGMLGRVAGLLGICLPIVGVAIAYAVVYYMALYDVYKSLDPGNCVLFLVLSILFNITEPFFLFFNRNKDQGMPPRRQESAYTPPREPRWQPQDPWDNKDYL